jgi:hypothetical protein
MVLVGSGWPAPVGRRCEARARHGRGSPSSNRARAVGASRVDRDAMMWPRRPDPRSSPPGRRSVGELTSRPRPPRCPGALDRALQRGRRVAVPIINCPSRRQHRPPASAMGSGGRPPPASEQDLADHHRAPRSRPRRHHVAIGVCRSGVRRTRVGDRGR